MKLWISNNVAAREFKYVKWTLCFFFVSLPLFLQIPEGKTKMFSEVVICIMFEASGLHVQD